MIYRKLLVLSVAMVLVLSMVSVGVMAQDGPSGIRVESHYVTMRDGVEIAVDVYFPTAMEEGQQYPTLMVSTRYWRAIQNLDVSQIAPETIPLTEAGYVVVRVDARGSGASGGDRPIEWSQDEVADYGEIAQWITDQLWSNGRIGAYGVSYNGNTAELTVVPHHSAIKAVAPQYSDFDPLIYLAMPGGVFNQWFIQGWSDVNVALDTNDICFIAETESEEECQQTRLFHPGVKFVDSDPNGEHLAELLAERDNLVVYDALAAITYRGDWLGENGETLELVSPYGLRGVIESSAVPMNVWASWLDAGTVDGALSRYLTFSNPQQVIIGPWSHGGGEHTDPFLPANTPTDPAVEEQLAMLVAFFDPYLKTGVPPTPERSIHYFTLNSGEWHTTNVWPPEGVITQSWYFAADGLLTPDVSSDESGADEYTVDYSATTGEANRWHTQFGGDVIYPDRAQEDEKLLTYTTVPFENDVEITGSPTITLYLASTATDGAFYAYLEDVAPDGRVTYITEGILRAIHHPVSEAEPPYAQLGPYHSYTEADAAFLVPGEVTEITFGLYATSVHIDAGHSIRIAIAGHDSSVFERYPAKDTPILTVQRNSVYASRIDLPIVE